LVLVTTEVEYTHTSKLPLLFRSSLLALMMGWSEKHTYGASPSRQCPLLRGWLEARRRTAAKAWRRRERHAGRHIGWPETGRWTWHARGRERHWRASQRWLAHGRHHAHTASCRHTSARASWKRVLLVVVDNGRRSLDTDAHDCFSTKDHKAECPLHFLLRGCLGFTGLLLRSDASELFALCDDEVHVAVEREHLTDERASIVNGDFEPPVDEAKHLATF